MNVMSDGLNVENASVIHQNPGLPLIFPIINPNQCNNNGNLYFHLV